MISSEKDFLQFLDEYSFIYQRVEHPAVFTCAEAELHRPTVPAVSTKNLFLCDKKARRFFLVVTSCEKTVRLDALALQLGVGYLRFASEENLQRLLGVTRGAVTMMGLANDSEQQVELWIELGDLAGRILSQSSACQYGNAGPCKAGAGALLCTDRAYTTLLSRSMT